MVGEQNLQTLLRSMEPELHEEVYVFATISDPSKAESLKPRLQFVESEGTTLIVPHSDAEAAEIDYTFPCRMITLKVHSSLEAVGFIATIASCLSKESIGVNPVSGFYHDHLFVPAARAEDALRALQALSLQATGRG